MHGQGFIAANSMNRERILVFPPRAQASNSPGEFTLQQVHQLSSPERGRRVGGNTADPKSRPSYSSAGPSL